MLFPWKRSVISQPVQLRREILAATEVCLLALSIGFRQPGDLVLLLEGMGQFSARVPCNSPSGALPPSHPRCSPTPCSASRAWSLTSCITFLYGLLQTSLLHIYLTCWFEGAELGLHGSMVVFNLPTSPLLCP